MDRRKCEPRLWGVGMTRVRHWNGVVPRAAEELLGCSAWLTPLRRRHAEPCATPRRNSSAIRAQFKTRDAKRSPKPRRLVFRYVTSQKRSVFTTRGSVRSSGANNPAVDYFSTALVRWRKVK